MAVEPVTVAIVGAGSRGAGYAEFALQHPDRMRVVAVAEPRESYRQRIESLYSIPSNQSFDDWNELASRPKMADAVVIATQDSMHRDPAIALADLGYQILLEKPMAPTEADCIRIVDATERNKCILAVGHVMRYTDFSVRLKRIVDSNLIGRVASVEHMEPVGYWHMAHSFVRGNWRNSIESSPMLLAKSCHDLDWLSYIIGLKCLSVSSFGSLLHFTNAAKPTEAGNAKRCLDCAHESRCAYSARKIYLDRLQNGDTGWPVNVLTPEVTEASIEEALAEGPYGRCVYECDNDVVDHQVVSLRYEDDVTASFTMTAFSEASHRKTRIFGTNGMLDCDGRYIRHFDFLTDTWDEIDTASSDSSISGGHGGGDYRFMDAFVSAVANENENAILSGPRESLETHQIVFAAERSRTTGYAVNLS